MRILSVLICALMSVGTACIDERRGNGEVVTLPPVDTGNEEADTETGEGEVEEEAQPETPKAGNDSCLDIKNCIENCHPLGGDCAQACFEFGTIKAQHTYTALEYCNAVNNCLGNPDCIAEECNEEAENCGVLDPTPPGPATCVGIFECFDGCGPRGRPCLYACVEQAEPSAQQAYDGLASCMDRHCEELQENEELRECAERECQQELRACFGQGEGGGSGRPDRGDNDLSCPEIIDCFSRCGEGNQQCQTTCFQDGAPDAQQALMDLEQCVETNCTDLEVDEFRECAEIECVNELSACMNGQL